MQLACQCICAWSQAWNPTSADRSLLPPLSPWEQLLILLPAGLVSRLLVGSVSPSALLWPAPPAAAGSGSAPGCEQTGEVRQEQRRLVPGENSRMEGEGAWYRKPSPLPADKATALEAQYSMQGTRVSTSFPYSGKERGSGYTSASCASHLGRHLLLARLHVQLHVIALLSVPTELAFCHWHVSLPAVPASENPTNHHYLLTAQWQFSLAASDQRQSVHFNISVLRPTMEASRMLVPHPALSALLSSPGAFPSGVKLRMCHENSQLVHVDWGV